jgi:Ca-activated chloride channel family protein
MRWQHPEYFWLILGLGLFAFLFLLYARRRRRRMQMLIARKLWPTMLQGFYPNRRISAAVLQLLALLTIVFALANPQIGTRIEAVKRQGVDIVVALDVSLSMQTEDIAPSRLEKAKFAVSRLIDMLRGDRIGLVGFAGIAFAQCPLTVDYAAASLFLKQMNTDLIPVQGTALGEALKTASGMFEADEKKYKVLIVISDGEDQEGDLLARARAMRENGVLIHTIGVGSRQGGPIPIGRQKFKRGADGRVVISRLEDDMLRQLAVTGGGIYKHVDSGNSGLDDIYGAIAQMQRKDLGQHEFSTYDDRYHGFAILAVLFLICSEIIVFAWRRKHA